MLDSQEIIERSMYTAILNTALKLGYTLDPSNYLPANSLNSQKLKEDMKKLDKFVYVFGSGNSFSKDQKITPRIVIHEKGFYPGAIGIPRKLLLENEGIGFTATEVPYETIDQYIDIHIVAQNQADIRLLHQLLFWSIPQRGYIKPYNAEKFLPTGNIFLELVNFFDRPDLEYGLIEKIYEFEVYDCLLPPHESTLEDVPPIKDISVFLDDLKKEELVNVKSQNP